MTATVGLLACTPVDEQNTELLACQERATLSKHVSVTLIHSRVAELQ